MIALTYQQVAWIVLISALVGGTLVVYGIQFLAWTDRRRGMTS